MPAISQRLAVFAAATGQSRNIFTRHKFHPTSTSYFGDTVVRTYQATPGNKLRELHRELLSQGYQHRKLGQRGHQWSKPSNQIHLRHGQLIHVSTRFVAGRPLHRE